MTRRIIAGERPTDLWTQYDAAVAATDAALARLGAALGSAS